MGHKYEPVPHKGDFYKKAWGYELWIINDEEYCGKLLVFDKDKKFSMHYHLIKKESWYVAKGEFEYSWIDTEKAAVKTVTIQEGDVIDLERGQPHQLTALTEGATIFEVSTKHYEEDSYRIIPGSSQEDFVNEIIQKQLPETVVSRDLTKFWSLNDKLVDFSNIDFFNISQAEVEVEQGWEAAMYWSNIAHKELDNEFLGRVASTYDIRFYNDDISYLIKSGSISISVAYNTVHLMNTNTVEPFYSPQSFEINFDMTLISKIDDYENINTNNSNIYANYPNFDVNLNNLTFVVGQRHLKLGQASLITSSYLKLKGKIVEVDLKFKSFARMEN